MIRRSMAAGPILRGALAALAVATIGAMAMAAPPGATSGTPAAGKANPATAKGTATAKGSAKGTPAAEAKGPREGFAADPPAHATEKQWVFEVAYDNGASAVTSARSANAKKPIATARAMGRFALELWVGKELLDRVRFDVPLLGDDSAYRDTKGYFKKPTFQRVTTKLKVQMADSPRATVLSFVDRSTGEARKYFWPPDEKGQLTPFSAKAATGEATPAATSVPVAGTSAPVAGTSVPVVGTSAPVAGTSAPVAGTSAPVAPVAGTSAPVAGAAPAPTNTAAPSKPAAPANTAAPNKPAAPANTAAPSKPAAPANTVAPANTAARNRPVSPF